MNKLTCMTLLVGIIIVQAIPAFSQDNETMLKQMCMEEGNPPACCDCGYQVFSNTFNDQEVLAFMEVIQLMDSLETATAANDEPRISEITARLQELETVLPEARFNELETAIDTQCVAVCPEQ